MKTQKKVITTVFASLMLALNLVANTQAKAGEVNNSANAICQCVDKGGGANCGAIQSTTSGGGQTPTSH